MSKLLQPFMASKRPAEVFQANIDIPFKIPLGGKITKGYVILEGDVTISGGTTNGTAVGEGGPVNLIKKIIVRANPAAGSRYFGGELVNCTPRALLRNAILERSKFLGEQAANTLGAGAAATYAGIYCAIPIYFADPNVARQFTTALNADEKAYESIEVIVSTGDLTSCFSGNDRVGNFANLKVRWVDERHDFEGDTLCLFQEDHKALIGAAKDDFVDAGMKNDGLCLSWLVMTESTAQSNLVDTLLNKVKIQGDGVYFDLTAKDIRQKLFDDGWYDAGQTATGQYFIDFSDGNIFKPVPLAGMTHTFDVNMVSAANIDGLRIMTRRYFAPNGFDPAKPMAEYRK